MWIRIHIAAFVALITTGCAAPGVRTAREFKPPTPARTELSSDEFDQLKNVQAQQALVVVEIRTEFLHENRTPDQTEDTMMVVTESGGSGIVIDPDGLILTNNHVITGADRIFVRLPDGEWPVLAFRPHGRFDLAVLKVAHKLPSSIHADPTSAATGAAVVALSGVPSQVGGAFGIVTRPDVCLQDAIAPDGPLDYRQLVECTAPLRPGFSGGPVFTSTGQWIGVSVAAAESARAADIRGYLIPLNDDTRSAISELVDSLRNSVTASKWP